MGVSYRVKALIGVKLTRSPFVEETVRVCSHDLPKGDAAFCPKCGEKLWTVETKPVAGYDPDSMDNFWGPFVVHSHDESEDYYVGLCPVELGDISYAENQEGSYELPTLLDIGKLAAELKEFLAPHGLWDDDFKVKLWVIGNVG